MHSTFRERYVVEENIRGAFRDESVHMYPLPLRVAPDAANQLSVLLRGPKSILRNEVSKYGSSN